MTRIRDAATRGKSNDRSRVENMRLELFDVASSLKDLSEKLRSKEFIVILNRLEEQRRTQEDQVQKTLKETEELEHKITEIQDEYARKSSERRDSMSKKELSSPELKPQEQQSDQEIDPEKAAEEETKAALKEDIVMLKELNNDYTKLMRECNKDLRKVKTNIEAEEHKYREFAYRKKQVDAQIVNYKQEIIDLAKQTQEKKAEFESVSTNDIDNLTTELESAHTRSELNLKVQQTMIKKLEDEKHDMEASTLMTTSLERAERQMRLQTDSLNDVEAVYTPTRRHFKVFNGSTEVLTVKVRCPDSLPPELAELNPNESFFFKMRGFGRYEETPEPSKLNRSNSKMLDQSPIITAYEDATPNGDILETTFTGEHPLNEKPRASVSHYENSMVKEARIPRPKREMPETGGACCCFFGGGTK